jgi:GPH family glycoside/pentoside/hexuronide:cation symporter
MAWGAGGLADNYIMNVVTALGMVIYVSYFKLDPRLAGIALFVPRLVDAFFDPWLGNFSDNFHSRLGRRRPFMFVGLILCALLMPFLWTPPLVHTVTAAWYANLPFLYITVIGVAYALAYSLFVVPYTALGYELTNDYDERTRTLAWRMYIGLLASMTVPGLYKLCVLDFFPNEGIGAVWVSVVLAVIVLISGMITVTVCRERPDVQVHNSVSIRDALRYTLINKPFMILSTAYIVVIIGLFSAANMGMFMNIFYVCRGDKGFAGTLGFYGGIVGALTSYLSMYLIARVSMRWSKRFGMNLGLGLGFIGTVSCWFTFDPRWPYAQLISGFIGALGMQGCWLMISSMIADVCDEDELLSGVRREGMFGAVNAFTQKLAIALTSLIGGMMVSLSGFDPNTMGSGELPHHTAMIMKTLIIGAQVAGLALAMLIFIFYPISRERAAETRRKLNERHAAKTLPVIDPDPIPVDRAEAIPAV